MEKNVGTGDRVVRVIIAAALGLLVYLGLLTGTAGMVTTVVAILLLLSALLARSLVYKLAGIDTTTEEASYSTTDDRAGF